MRKPFIYFITLCFCFFNSGLSWADASVQEDLKTMKEQMVAMQAKIASLEAKVAQQQVQLASQPTPVAATPNRLIPGKWTPEIGVVADVVTKLNSSKEDADGNNRLSLREFELVLGSNVDPFSRLDATISFSDTDTPSLEEAYLTRFGLPLDTTARVGKFKPKIGKVLGAHRDSLDTVDEPLVIQRYFGSEGMNKTGVDFTKTLDLPLPVTQQVVVGVLEGGVGDGGNALGTARRSPTLYTHLKNYADITDTMGVELGASYMAGSKDDVPNFNAQVLGLDASLIKHLSANQDIKLQGEAFNVDHKKTEGVDGNTWGAYGLLDVHFLPQWSVGVRYDYVQLIDNPVTNAQKKDIGETGYLTFYQSEYARWRVQYTHTKLATGKDDNTVYLQGTFAIGDHKHKLQ